MSTPAHTHTPGARITHPRHGAGTIIARHASLDGRVLVIFDKHTVQPRYFWPEEIA